MKTGIISIGKIIYNFDRTSYNNYIIWTLYFTSYTHVDCHSILGHGIDIGLMMLGQKHEL